MTDIPVEPKPETPIEDTKKSTLPGNAQGLKLQQSNADIITIKLLESIQNIGIRQVKILEAIAQKQGIDVKTIK
jgi:hypothetical protein